MDVTNLNMGDVITINTAKGEVTDEAGKVLTTFDIKPNTVPDEFQAGGRIPLIIGRNLTELSREALNLGSTDIFALPENPTPKADQGYSQAQKMVGRACGVEGILPGAACEPIMTTVGSQDTTGPMTADEIKELACLKFKSPLVMQSFCHTAAYPKPADVKMHANLPTFIADREGVALRPGDGVIHSWLNRLLVPELSVPVAILIPVSQLESVFPLDQVWLHLVVPLVLCHSICLNLCLFGLRGN